MLGGVGGGVERVGREEGAFEAWSFGLVWRKVVRNFGLRRFEDNCGQDVL